jgi:protein gp37
MALNSAIEWCDATWNPVSGCTKVSPGCKFCYAERLTERFGRRPFSEIVLHPERLDLPLRWKGPRRIFVNSMSDLFHEKVPLTFIDRVFEVMAQAYQHVFQVLTKRPDRLLAWHRSLGRRTKGIPPNVWLGVSVESPPYLWRVDRLRDVNAAVRFVSAEPLLGALTSLDLDGIAWVITGGESGGPSERALVQMTPHGWQPRREALAWVREIRDLCRRRGVAFFHKQWGGPTPRSGGRMLDGRVWSEFPCPAKAGANGTRADGRGRRASSALSPTAERGFGRIHLTATPAR